MLETGTLISSNTKIGRPELAQVPTPAATATHRPIPHHEIVEAWWKPSASARSVLSTRNTPYRRMA